MSGIRLPMAKKTASKPLIALDHAILKAEEFDLKLPVVIGKQCIPLCRGVVCRDANCVLRPYSTTSINLR